MELTVLTRGGQATLRPFPAGVRVLAADARDRAAFESVLAGESFDVAVNFIGFLPEHVERDLEFFSGRVKQYIFISSASVYQKPLPVWPIVETVPTSNPFWQYARDKIACEASVVKAVLEKGFPATIVRPSHTYDRTLLPFGPHGAGPTTLRRIQKGQPIVIHGDGTSLWTLTHHTDFALGLVGLFGKSDAIGETFHITSDKAVTWDEVAHVFARLAGTEPRIVHVPSDLIAHYHTEWGASLLGDKAHSALFDNSKVRRIVPEFVPRIPFEEGAEEIYEFHTSLGREPRIDPALDALIEELTSRFAPSGGAVGGPSREC